MRILFINEQIDYFKKISYDDEQVMSVDIKGQLII